jgi:SAM-dependent methyltransferase
MGARNVTKPTTYPTRLSDRTNQEWRAYDDYYSEKTLEQPYFYHHHRYRGRERRFVAGLQRKFGMSAGSALIDVGCGNGLYSKLWSDQGLVVTGLDRSPKAIDYCKRKYGSLCNWVCDDAFEFARSTQYDYAFCFWFMYFNAFENPADGAEDARRLMECLKPGGKLIFVWHSDLTSVRLPPDRFSVMNFTLAQLIHFFPTYQVRGYAIDSPAVACTLFGRYAFNDYVTRLASARVYMQASTWKRARLIVAVEKS